MTSEQLKIFKKAFFEANYGKCSFPKKISLTENNKIEFYTNGMRGGLSVDFRFKQNENGEYYLELYGRDDYSSWRKRISSDGNIETIDFKI